MSRRFADEMDNEAGFTLVECLVTISIVGVAFSALLGGMYMTIVGSDYHQKQADVELALASTAEWIKKQPYVPCSTATTTPYQPVSGSVSVPLDVSVPVVADFKCWNKTTGAFEPWVVGKTDTGLQQLTITAASLDSRASYSLTVTKRAS